MKQIPLTQGKVALVDDEDYDRLVAMGKWKYQKSSSGGGYASKSKIRRKEDGKYTSDTILMHRFIMNASKGFDVDHGDSDGLNNQKYNLKTCTHAENMRNMKKPSHNTSGFKGVHFYKSRNKWTAQIQVNLKTIHLGYFESPILAAKKYNEAARTHFGEFAKLNEI